MYLIHHYLRTFLLLLLPLLSGCQSAALTAAKLYIKEDDLQRAQEQLDKALRENPKNAEIHFLIGRIAAARGDFATMDSAFTTSAALSDKFHEEIDALRQKHWARSYNTGVGYTISPEPNLKAALRAFGNAIIIDPRPLESWHNIAYVYYQLDSLAAAAQIYDHVLASVPDDTASLAGLSGIYLERRQFAKAAPLLAHLIDEAPRDVKARINLGMAYEQLDRQDEAEASYLEAIRLQPENALAHYNLGNLYWKCADFAAAREVYERTLELNPRDDDARYNLAATYIKLDEADLALSLLQDLVRKQPDNAAIWRELGRLYAIKGMAEKSRQAYSKAEALPE